MISFHNIRSITVTEPHKQGDIYTSEIVISDGNRDFEIDLFAKEKRFLRVIDYQMKTLKNLFQELVNNDTVKEN